MFKVVLTGGPSSGKTTLSTQLKEYFGDKVLACPEAAEMLFKGGFPRRDDTIGLKERQYAIFHLQKALANLTLSQNPQTQILLFDRGLLDGLCYWPDTWESFALKMNIDINQTRLNYDLIIQLGVADINDYKNTSYRTEDQKTSLIMEQKLKEIWSSHPNYHFISYTKDWDQKVNQCIKLINR